MPSNMDSSILSQSKIESGLQQEISMCLSAAQFSLSQGDYHGASSNYKVIMELLHKKQDDLSVFDTELLENASYMVALLSSYVEEDLLPNPPQFSYEDTRVMEQTRLLLNITPVYRNPAQNISDMFEIYSDVLQDETSQTFSQSLSSSRLCYENNFLTDENIQKLILNDKDSFLVIPIRSSPHTLSAVVRRTDEGFSVTLVNKGRARFHERGESTDHAEYEEFIFRSAAPSVDFFTLAATVDDVYHRFEASVPQEDHYRLNLISREQTTGNCHFKECETGVKFAAFSRDKDVRSFRLPQVAGQSPQKVTWPQGTESTHQRYIDALAIKNPSVAEELRKIEQIHSKNKHFRDLMAQRSASTPMTLQDFQDILEKSFGTRDVEEALKEIEIYSLSTYGTDILKVIPENKAFAELVGMHKNIFSHNPTVDPRLYPSICSNLAQKFPTAVAQIKIEKSIFLQTLSGNKSSSPFDRNMLLQAAIQLNPTYDFAITEYIDLCKTQGKYLEAVNIIEKFAGIAFQGEASNMMFQIGSECFANGNKELAEQILKKTLALNPRNTAALKLMACCCIDKNNFMEAQILLENANKLSSAKDPQVLMNLQLVYSRLGNHIKAVKVLRKLENLRPSKFILDRLVEETFLLDAQIKKMKEKTEALQSVGEAPSQNVSSKTTPAPTPTI